MNISATTPSANFHPVTAVAQRRADSDGDGKTGAAALNDGDSAARAAKAPVAGRTVDVHA